MDELYKITSETVAWWISLYVGIIEGERALNRQYEHIQFKRRTRGGNIEDFLNLQGITMQLRSDGATYEVSWPVLRENTQRERKTVVRQNLDAALDSLRHYAAGLRCRV